MLKKVVNPFFSLIHKRLSVFAILFGCLLLTTNAQDRKVQKGIDKYEFKAYKDAIDLLKSALEDNKNDNVTLRYLANSYRQLNDYQNAELYFALVVNSDSVIDEDYFYYGQALRANGKMIEAKEQFKKFASTTDNNFLGTLVLQSFDEIFKWELEGSKYKSFYDENINTQLSEFNLVRFKDRFYITSNRLEDFNSPESFNWDETPFLSILEIDTALIGVDQPPFSEVPGLLNTAYHDGPISIYKDRVIITRVNNKLAGNNYINRMKLFEGIHENGKWKNFKAVPFNSDEYSVGHACYADSGNSIIFSSDMPGGYGGMDLYISKKVEGEWEEPKNLGPIINTQMDEVFPYVKDQNLYYSSDGFVGYGGLDLYVSKFGKSWSKPENLKSPINSNRDDFGITFISDSTGYYSSNRAEGKGEDDLYRFYKSHQIQSVGVGGVFEYNGLPAEGVRITLVDGKDSVIAATYTDSSGRFNFSNLRYQEDYLIKVETEDTDLMEDGMLYLTDQDGDKIKLIERLQDGKFKFKALPVDEIDAEQIAAFDNDSLPDDPYIRGNIYETLPGDFNDEVKVYLVNDEGTIIDSTFSDLEGSFKFSKLGLEDNREYFVQIDAVDEAYSVAFINNAERIYHVADSKEGYGYKFLSELDPSVQPTITTKKGLTGIIARLEHNGKPLPFVKVQIYDENNNLVATVFTNEKGEFQYNKLDIDENYLFKLPDVSDEVKKDAFLYVINTEGDPLYLINKLRDNNFQFTALPFDEHEGVQLLEEEAVPDLIDLSGVVFKKLKGDLGQSLKVYLLDDQGNIIDSVFTGMDGQFDFERLPSEKTYSFKLEEAKDLNLGMLNKFDQIIEQTKINQYGNFEYKKLTYMVAQFEPVKAVDPTEGVYSDVNIKLYGQVFKKLPGDYKEGMKVLIYDENGNLVGSALTDEEGRFNYSKLKPDETYVFKVEGEDGDYQIITLDDEGNVLSKVIKNEYGEFEYKTLPVDKYRASKIKEKDETDFYSSSTEKKKEVEKLPLDTFLVYYRFDSSNLNTTSKTVLNQLLQQIKGQEVAVEVRSHTDIRGTEEYNYDLSKRRNNSVIDYLVKNGVNRKQVKGRYFGELKPKIDCLRVKCTNKDHAINRRSEIVVKTIN